MSKQAKNKDGAVNRILLFKRTDRQTVYNRILLIKGTERQTDV